MVDQNQSPSPPTPPTTKQTEFTRQTKSEIHEPSHRHAYDDPGITAREFLLRVMRDKDTPVRTRMKAASELLRLFGNDGFGSPRLTIVIGGIPDQDSVTRDPGADNRNQQPNLSDRSYSSQPHDRELGHPNFEERYLDPLSPDDIQQIKAAVQALHPNADLSSIPTPHLCPCGHWIVGSCDCPSRRSSLN
jgi:hypothetical protein